MPIQTAQAQLTCQARVVAVTGFVYYQQGQLDSESNTIKAVGTSRWGSLTTWDSYRTYIQQPSQILWTAPVIDLGTVDVFCLNIEAVFAGTINYLVHVSDTGQFVGEETEHELTDGQLNIAAFRGAYVYVTARVTGASLTQLTVSTTRELSTVRLSNVNTSQLGGTITARPIPLPATISEIYSIHIQPQAATSYPVNLYVSDTANSQVLTAVVNSKSINGATFALYGIDNDARNGVVDITITALPRMVMLGGSVLTIT